MVPGPGIPTENLRSVVAATDLSDNAATAVRWAAAIAADHQASLHILSVSNLAGWATDYLEIDAQVPSRIREATLQQLEETAVPLRNDGLTVSCEVTAGEPCEVILSVAGRHQADLIVVGARGQRGLDYLLLGSTAQRVVQRAVCPVLTVHPQDAEKQRPVRRILVATDFSAEADSALIAALRLSSGRPADTRVSLLHAFLVPYDLINVEGQVSTAAGHEQWQSAQVEVEHRLESRARSLREAGIRVEISGLEGYPPEVIIDKASELEVDLIAMGTHGRTGLSHVLLGSTAERVIHRAPCPVLTVRKQEMDPEGGNDAG